MLLLKLRRWINTAPLRWRGARMFDCRTTLSRRLYLRETYWMHRIYGMPHVLARRWAIRHTVGQMKLDRSSDRLAAVVREIVDTLNVKTA